jgi:probable phosphoglycerate mutase
MKIIIVRHGETAWNREEIFRGRIDIPLSKNGLKQVRILSSSMKDFRIDKIFSSPLKRAIQTAKEIAKFQNAEFEIDHRLVDMSFGIWEGMSLEKVKRKFPEEYKIWKENPEKLKIPGGETLKDIRERVENFLKEKIFSLKKDKILIVSHRVINKILFFSLLGISNRYFWNIKQDVAKYSIFEKTYFGWAITKHNQGFSFKKTTLKDF